MANQGSNLVTVTCSGHHDYLASGLYNYFLAHHGVDFEVQWGERTVRAHRLVLDLFLSPDKLTGTVADPHSCSPEPILEFLYNGTVTLPEEQLENLLDLAKELDFKMLVDAVESARTSKNKPTDIRGSSESKEPTAGPSTSSVNRRKRKNCPRKLESANRDDDYVGRGVKGNEAADEPEYTKRLRSSNATKPTIVEPETESDDSYTIDVDPVLDDDSDDSDDQDSYSRHSNDSDPNAAQPLIRPNQTGTQLHLPPHQLYCCQQCTYRTHKEERMQAHRSSHATDSPEQPVAAGENPQLIRKAQGGSKPTWHRCKLCPYKSRSAHRNRVHQAKHDTSIKIYKCQWCPKKFFDPAKLARHKCMRLAGANLHQCPHCDYKSQNQRAVRLHVARHDPNAKTSRCKCGLGFADDDALSRHHCKWSAPDAKPFQCPHCPYTNKFSHQLGYHIKGMHSATKPYKCQRPGCTYETGHKTSLRIHDEIVHLDLKPFVCEKCAYRTWSQSRLTKHQRVHSDERMYKCDECDRTFRNCTSLKEHKERHAGVDRSHVCHLCGSAFYRRDTLRTHLKNVHKGEVDAAAAL